MNAVVTGAAGFIGSHVVDLLLARSCRVLAVDDLSGGFIENVPLGADFEQRSVVRPLDDLFESFRPTVVYHLAAYAAEGLSHHIPMFNYENNLIGTANVLSAAYKAGARHLVYTSSIAAYGHPVSTEAFDEETPCRPCDPYGIAKFACEQHIRAFREYYGSPSCTIFRPHNVFGPRQNIADPYRNVVGIFMNRAIRDEPLPIFGDGLQTRSFSYISTVAQCIAEAGWLPAAVDETFNVGGDSPMSVVEIARRVSEVMGVPERIHFMPPRKEVVHAHCQHARARTVFTNAYEDEIDIVSGLRAMAQYVRGHAVPAPTECPAPIEIHAELPASWAGRLAPLPAEGGTRAILHAVSAS